MRVGVRIVKLGRGHCRYKPRGQARRRANVSVDRRALTYPVNENAHVNRIRHSD